MVNTIFLPIFSKYFSLIVPEMVLIAIQNFQCPGVTRITIPTRISPLLVCKKSNNKNLVQLFKIILQVHQKWRASTGEPTVNNYRFFCSGMKQGIILYCTALYCIVLYLEVEAGVVALARRSACYWGNISLDLSDKQVPQDSY